ncbi:50S ribosomal protein L4 [Desulfomonile tiedjei]|uniref:Large ribosomal subunit protein uL4 n=1 Tax=Desulfomonile tiedjei (strain ATCC 49306 / DSM 6799 / DCB-1) TaxID=706587 RepID=I4CE62_DESTA|nr:50S ribosomal protein L4 [Desulfomonile tiedjei]AFM27853.1 50S ribosomal protein L4, bacterial/organelle [Desulfomonile tiedjei DSM 6799]
MASVDVINQKGVKVDTIELDDRIFNVESRDQLVQQVVVWQQAKRRCGTAATKTRGQISGGGKKPWRQKGTGRARAGTNRSPVWVGGGTVFGPHPRSYAFSLPKKVRKEALRSVLSSRLRDNNLFVVDKIELESPKTKLFLETVKAMGLDTGKTLFVTSEKDETLSRSSRNLYHVMILPTEGLNVYDLLRYDRLVLLQDAVPKIHERLG